LGVEGGLIELMLGRGSLRWCPQIEPPRGAALPIEPDELSWAQTLAHEAARLAPPNNP
jgi:hypothetical protein